MLQPSFGLAILLTTLVALGPLSTDLYLPALPTLAQAFATDAARVQLTLSVFLAGFAVAQLFYGPLSDRYGRRPVMLFGLVLYLVSSVACMLATSIDALILARFFQALGACAGPVLGRAIVRDVYGPVQAARVLAYISGAMAIAPMIGPLLGGWLTVWFGWRANFAALSLFSAVQVTATFLLLGESNAHRDPGATRPRQILGNFGELLSARLYLGYLLCFSFSYAALFSFISGSSFVLIELYGLSPQWYGASFGFVVTGYISGTMASGKLTLRLGPPRMVLMGAFLGTAAGTLMAALALLEVHSVWAILLPMFAFMVATGLVMPNAIGGALAPYPKMAGSASALMGFVQMSLSAGVGIAVGHAYAGTAIPMAGAIALCGWMVLASYFLLVRRSVPA
ncbi:MAG: multidrug effflux MFS transporter [Rhodocyclaceae bacterium]|jgi:DHA1 family bicyclomycin/chloramphenicol resistance-like MFS transporter|nr:multidrug effflux MFS transporter [Rhodocyclaceae bacterium]GIK25022.1 MAG: Bcr/CflA family drug resistance efflux transporter [Betaproteobacteria bacterium]